jgi:hypothetical protein
MGRQRKIFGSGKGDSWWLYRDDCGSVFVLQEDYSGQITKWEIASFLSHPHPGPEHQALVDLIGKLTELDSGL